MNFYKHHLGDYDSATVHLSWLEDCAYTRLLRIYYRTEQPLPSDVSQVNRLVRATSKAEREAVQQVLKEFFQLEGDGWHNKRCDEEIASNADADIEREFKKENERERQRRHREERSAFFEALRNVDIVPPYDTSTTSLRELFHKHVKNEPVTRDELVTGDVTEKPVTRTATANQTPDTRHQTPDSKNNNTPPAPPDPPADAGTKPLSVSDLIAEGVDAVVANDWFRVRKAKRAPLTRTAWEAIKREASKARLSTSEAVRLAAESGWQGFKAEWIQKTSLSTAPPTGPAEDTRDWAAIEASVDAKLKSEGKWHEQSGVRSNFG